MIAFVSILYNPGINAIRNIIAAKNNGFIPIVYINTANQSIQNDLLNLGIYVLGDNTNIGLGSALNQIESFLISHEINHYIYFDQDTVVSNEAWLFINNTYLNYIKSNTGLIFYSNEKDSSSDIVLNSGCLFPIETLLKVGLHDKTYFVEGVDYEYCFRIKISGLKIVYVACDGIDHRSLQDLNEITVLGFKLKFRVYGNSRLIDFNKSHFRLIGSSLKYFELSFFIFFIKSIISFNLKEIYSRFLRFIF